MAVAANILAMSADQIPEFITEQRQAGTLVRVIQELNAAVLGDDAGAHDMAEAALARMGLLEVA